MARKGRCWNQLFLHVHTRIHPYTPTYTFLCCRILSWLDLWHYAGEWLLHAAYVLINWSLSAISHSFIELLSHASTKRSTISPQRRSGRVLLPLQIHAVQESCGRSQRGPCVLFYVDPQHHTHMQLDRSTTDAIIGKKEQNFKKRGESKKRGVKQSAWTYMERLHEGFKDEGE